MRIYLNLEHSMVPIYDVFESADLGLYGGFVVISGGDQTYRVPFMGLKGDYTKMNVLGTVAYGSVNSCEHFTPKPCMLSIPAHANR